MQDKTKTIIELRKEWEDLKNNLIAIDHSIIDDDGHHSGFFKVHGSQIEAVEEALTREELNHEVWSTKPKETCNVFDHFDRKSGSKVWPSSDSKDSPFDMFTCKYCGESLKLRMYGMLNELLEESFEEKARIKLAKHLIICTAFKKEICNDCKFFDICLGGGGTTGCYKFSKILAWHEDVRDQIGTPDGQYPPDTHKKS